MSDVVVHEMKIRADSVPAKVAGAVASTFRDIKNQGQDPANHRIAVVAIGAGAVNQMVKAYAIAKGYVAAANVSLSFDVGFKDLMVDGEERTAMEFIIGARIVG